MDLKYCHYFLVLCESRNISNAAEELFISQQGLSQIIKKIEQELDVPLFRRTRSGLELTQFGILFNHYAKDLMDTYHTLEEDIDFLKKGAEQTLDLSIPYGLLQLFDPQFLSQFLLDNSHSIIRVQEVSHLLSEETLIQQQADIGFCVHPINNPQLELLYTKTLPVYALIHQDNLLSNKQILYMKELKNERLIALTFDAKGEQIVLERFMREDCATAYSIRISERDVLKSLCENNIGIGFFAGKGLKINPSVKYIPISDWSFTFSLTAYKGRPHSQTFKNFVCYTKDYLDAFS